MDITPYLQLLRDKNGSDLFFTVGAPVKIKIEGSMNSVGKTLLTGEVVKAAAYGIMNDKQVQHFEDTMECDFAIALPDKSARFRVNILRQRGDRLRERHSNQGADQVAAGVTKLRYGFTIHVRRGLS